jgi:hypothetical protein
MYLKNRLSSFRHAGLDSASSIGTIGKEHWIPGQARNDETEAHIGA